MTINLLDKIGDWNPQLFREIKGRLKVFPVIIAVATSLLVQLFVFLYQLQYFPGEKYSIFEKYCQLRLSPEQERQKFQLSNQEYCPLDQIDMQAWWRDHWEHIFLTLSVIFIFTLLVAGTYLLINNLAQEERRGTLNFIRLSPSSEKSILTGKILGVPILVYLFVFTALPLHFLAGRAANISTSYILSFYTVIIACCAFFYSGAVLFGLCCHWLGGFQPWFGSSAVLLFLLITLGLATSNSEIHPLAFLGTFSPWDLTNYLFPRLFRLYRDSPLQLFHFFYFPVGKSYVTLVGFYLLNYGLWTYWIWQALERCFRNPNATIVSKRQSYLIISCLQIFSLGFLVGFYQNSDQVSGYEIRSYLVVLSVLNLLLFLGLIAALSPDRQTLQDWARYRHQNDFSQEESQTSFLLQDLIQGKKSPAILAIAVNLIIATTPFIVWISLWSYPSTSSLVDWIKTIMTVAIFMTLVLIYATLAQLMLLMQNPKREIWAVGTVAAAMFLPTVILSIVAGSRFVWLFSPFSWASYSGVSLTSVVTAFVSQLSILVILNFQLTRRLKALGESTTKALLAER